MEAWQQLILDGIGVLAAALYLYVGWLLLQRPVSDSNRGALRGFAVWWVGLAALAGLPVALRWLPDVEAARHLFAVAVFVLVAIMLASLAGLLYYLLVLYTGNRNWLGRVVAFYVLFAVTIALAVVAQRPYIGPEESGALGLQFHDALAPSHPVSLLLAAGLLLPPLTAALGFLLLYLRVEVRATRYRILMVAGSIALWFGYSTLSSAVGIATDASEQGFLQALVGQFLGLLSAAAVLLAYRPPAPVRKWLEAEAPGPETAAMDVNRRAAPWTA